jgi:hypothetical protein
MKSYIRFSVIALILFCSLALFRLPGRVVGIYLEKTPTQDQLAIGTLSALMLEGTQISLKITQIGFPVTPTPSYGEISGAICYPAQTTPLLSLYFKDLDSDRIEEVKIEDGQISYAIQLKPSRYLAYGWAPHYLLGGMYTNAAACGFLDECTDHSAQAFQVRAGATLENIDICDWIFSAEALPATPGIQLRRDRPED